MPADPPPVTAGGPRVVVVGGGLIGVCTALALGREGCKVTLLEAAAAPASLTSFANAGRFCPTHLGTYPLASPAVLRSLFTIPARRLKDWATNLRLPAEQAAERRLLRVTAEVPSSISIDFSLIPWGFWFLRNCTPGRYTVNNDAFSHLVKLSVKATSHLLDDFPGGRATVDYHPGNLWVFGTPDHVEHGQARAEQASLLGYKQWSRLDCDACAERYPTMQKFLQRVRNAPEMEPSCLDVRDDYTVDARKFCEEVVKLARSAPYSVDFRFNTEVVGLVTRRDPDSLVKDSKTVQGVIIKDADGAQTTIVADQVVVCCGPKSRAFVRQHCGESLQMLAMRGSSIELYGVKNGPKTAVVDYLSGPLNFQYTPLGPDKARLIGFADFIPLERAFTGSVDPFGCVKCDPGYSERLQERAKLLFPDMTWDSARAPWCGLRPLTPDGLPIVGRLAHFDNLWVNTGHGSVGWTLAAGTGLVLARALLSHTGDLREGSYTDRMTSAFREEGHLAVLGNERFSLRSLFASRPAFPPPGLSASEPMAGESSADNR